MLTIVAVTKDLMPRLVPLIDDYQRFYKCVPDSERNLKFFSDLVDKPATGKQFAALDESGAPLGFVTLYFLPSSLSARNYCLLNDLYTVPEARGKSVGRQLIEHCRKYCDVHGYDSMEWMTQKQNETAQRLYDSLTTDKSEWFIYSLPVEAPK
jgi:GNAT superfamily N-acetyltransferase